MNRLDLASPETRLEWAEEEEERGSSTLLLIIAWTTAALAVLTLGLFAGRELRFRYKFRRRTPSDFFSNAGDPISPAEYGMGV